MNRRYVPLVDSSGAVQVEAGVADEGDLFSGILDLHEIAAPLQALFLEFEEVVNGQMFVFLDEIQGKIDALALQGVFGDVALPIKDLQVFPRSGELSFRLVDRKLLPVDFFTPPLPVEEDTGQKDKKAVDRFSSPRTSNLSRH